MCFYNDDYDWIASVTEKSDGPAPTATRCGECGNPIAAGELRWHVYQQQHEECQICYEYNQDSELTAEERTHECNYGETFDYDCCERCHKVIEAIAKHEEREGCPPHSRRPSLMGLWEEIQYGETAEYGKAVIELYPELSSDPKVLALLETE